LKLFEFALWPALFASLREPAQETVDVRSSAFFCQFIMCLIEDFSGVFSVTGSIVDMTAIRSAPTLSASLAAMSRGNGALLLVAFDTVSRAWPNAQPGAATLPAFTAAASM
jgi:hypothetical protein